MSAPEEGGGGGPVYVPITTNYNPRNAICNPGSSDRITMNQNLGTALTASSMGAGISGWTFDVADALIRAVGGSNINYNGVMNVGGKIFGHASFFIGAIPAVVGLFDGDVTQLDMVNALGTVIGGTALVVTGWPALVAGGISLGVAVYVLANTPPDTVPSCTN